ncbi:putative mfs multidrug protein [Mycena venus]|uniref:Putative mfs multidrug protein n=1 Tax=Mycena venus TaxID=2733690 RepID=A0A8H7DA15_9AGAR|nr:putative mfs multidrug protein [Mycena venus]
MDLVVFLVFVYTVADGRRTRDIIIWVFSISHTLTLKTTVMPSLAALTIYLFGVTAFFIGVNDLLDTQSVLERLAFPTDCLPAAAGNSLAAIAMGIYYTLAAYQENQKFFIATVPMRCLTALVFWRQAWTAPAVWEGGGAILTAVALGLGRILATRKTKVQ